MRVGPWWTKADQAELDILIWDLICALEVIENEGKRRDVIGWVVDWFERRCLLSKAEWFGALHMNGRHG